MSNLAALWSSILAATIALIDGLTLQIPPSWCLMCRFNNRAHSHVRTEAEGTVPPSDCSTRSYTLRKLEDTDGESTTTAIVFNPRTKTYSLRKLEDIDVEKAIFRDSLPSSAASVKLHLPGETKLLSEVLLLDNETPRRTTRGLKYQPSLVDGIFIIPGPGSRAPTRTTTMTRRGRRSTYDPREGCQQQQRQQFPVELPATTPHGSLRRKYHHQHQRQQQQLLPVELPAPTPHGSLRRKYYPHPHPHPHPHQPPNSPIELPADDIISPAPVPVFPPSVVLPTPTPTPTPRLMVPRPRDRRERQEAPLLVSPPPLTPFTPLLPPPPPPAVAFLGVGGSERDGRRGSSASSVGTMGTMGGESIRIGYVPGL